jgi:uncharacterized membrane protein YfcA
MELILSFVGLSVGILSGFFGIGGGTVLIPILLLIGLKMSEAVGVSIVQMVFSSIYGSYLNYRRGSLLFGDGLFVGFGGFVGGYMSGYFTLMVDERMLQYIFIAFILFTIYRLSIDSHKEECDSRVVSKWTLFGIGMGIGVVSISIGVGGAIILIPLLSGFLHYPLKKAVSAGLFFVVFSSLSGLIGRLIYGEIDLYSGLIVGVASLAGVYIGISLKERVDSSNLRRLSIVLYTFVLVVMIYKI